MLGKHTCEPLSDGRVCFVKYVTPLPLSSPAISVDCFASELLEGRIRLVAAFLLFFRVKFGSSCPGFLLLGIDKSA